MVYMKVPVSFIIGIQSSLYRHPVYMMTPYAVFPLLFKLAFMLKDQSFDKGCHTLYHDHEIISIIIHPADVLFTEIPSVKYDPYVLITISVRFGKRTLKLRYIRYASQICLIE